MLRKMRVRMALLNALISGAILLAMALVGLNVAQNALSGQYERDLMRNTAQMVTTITGADADAQVQFASNYVLYQEQDGKTRFIGASNADSVELQKIVDLVREEVMVERTGPVSTDPQATKKFYTSLPDGAGQGAAAPSGATAQSGAIFRIGPVSTQAEQQGPAEPADQADDAAAAPVPREKDALFIQTSTLKIAAWDDVLVDQDGLSFRVTVPILNVSAERPEVIMVFQDRTDELNALSNLRVLFFGCALGGLILTLIASLYLSARAVRPVERSIRQQREFVAAASHELRTPIAALCANAEVLGDARLDEFEPYLQSITDESGRLGRLVGDLMCLARADADAIRMKEEPVDLMEVARQVAAAMRRLADNKRIELTESLDSVVVKGDAERLRQAAMALVDNAIRYTPEGGRVRVTTRRQGGYAVLQVTDNGPGIADEHKQRAFERFYRIDESRASDGGCGLGLSVAQSLIGQMGGSIALSDAPGGGCTFEIRFKSERRPRLPALSR